MKVAGFRKDDNSCLNKEGLLTSLLLPEALLAYFYIGNDRSPCIVF